MSFKLGVGVIHYLTAIISAKIYSITQHRYHEIQYFPHPSVAEMKFVKVLSDHIQAVEEILVALVLPNDSVSFFSLKRGDYSQCRSLIDPPLPHHVTVSVGPRLPIPFFLNPVSVC